MSLAPDVTVLEALEAEIRKHMSCVTPDRGWDSRTMREADLAVLDVLLDQYLDLGR